MNAGLSGTSPSTLAQACLARDGFRSKELSIYEVATRAIIRLRRLPGNLTAGEDENNLPGQPGQCAWGDPTVMCLRPGEWMIISESKPFCDLVRDAQSRWDSEAYVIFDETDGRTILNIEGEASPWLLRKHCSLDIGQYNQGQEACAQTRFGRISVLMHYRVNGLTNRFAVLVDRSLTRYLWELLASGIPHALELSNKFGARDPLQP